MVVAAGEEFRVVATPDQALLLKLAHLAVTGSDALLTDGVGGVRASFRAAGASRGGQSADLMLRAARLADPAYQVLSERINDDFDLMDEASVLALQEIEQELALVREQRERLLEQAYRDERGRRVFIAGDEKTAYYEDGTRLTDDEFTALGDVLRRRPTWEQWQEQNQKEEELLAERDQIHDHDEQRQRLRDDLAIGAVSAEDAEQRASEIDAAMPARMRRSYDDLAAKAGVEQAAPGASDDDTAPAEQPAAVNTVPSPAGLGPR